MTFFRSLAAAFSMFSAIPMPQVTWDAKSLRYVMCAFPLVGAVVGLALWGWAWLCAALGLGGLLPAAGFCLLPVLITGGVHLDGYADTCDALASHAEPGRKQEILSDPHTGAFAVIHLCCYFVAMFALCTALRVDSSALLCLGLGFVLSRAMSGLAVVTFPLAKSTGLAHTFATGAEKTVARRVLFVLALMLVASMLGVSRAAGMLMTAAALLVWLFYRRMAKKQFGGLSGDLSGWFLQAVELAMLASLVLAQHLEVLP